MNVLHIKYAVEVAKTKSISKAAEVLFTAQPNLSRAIKELEDDLGITIFKRNSKGITVTSEGEEFLTYAKKVIKQLDEIEDVYKNNKNKKQVFLASVQPSSYISKAFTEFLNNERDIFPADIYYKEAPSLKTINNLSKEDFNIGIIRYPIVREKYFKSLLSDKRLAAETIVEFSPYLIISKSNPLNVKDEISTEDLSSFIEILHPDFSSTEIDNKKSVISKENEKKVYVYERDSMLSLVSSLDNAFAWGAKLPKDVEEKHNLVSRKCIDSTLIYKDVLIYRKDYTLNNLDNLFITNVINAKRKYL